MKKKKLVPDLGRTGPQPSGGPVANLPGDWKFSCGLQLIDTEFIVKVNELLCLQQINKRKGLKAPSIVHLYSESFRPEVTSKKVMHPKSSRPFIELN